MIIFKDSLLQFSRQINTAESNKLVSRYPIKFICSRAVQIQVKCAKSYNLRHTAFMRYIRTAVLM